MGATWGPQFKLPGEDPIAAASLDASLRYSDGSPSTFELSANGRVVTATGVATDRVLLISDPARRRGRRREGGDSSQAAVHTGGAQTTFWRRERCTDLVVH
jgi:hypothetical protein